jgi:hypothetical protein
MHHQSTISKARKGIHTFNTNTTNVPVFIQNIKIDVSCMDRILEVRVYNESAEINLWSSISSV